MYLNALTLHSLGRRLEAAHVPLLPRLCESLTYLIFNCSIPLAAAIGEGSRCEHRGIGVVINRQAKIGRRCRIHAHVVVGGAGAGRVGAPTIGDDVTLGAGCKILGSITIGDGAQVGANAVVLQDIPAGAVAVGVPARIIGNDSGKRTVS